MRKAARPIDGAEGYRFFLRHGGAVELDEVNEYLRGIGLREVKPRMLRHYQKLQRHGYQSYVTHNRLDLAVAGDPGWLEELQARYAEIARRVRVEVTWDDVVAKGTAESIGLTSATIDVQPAPPANTPVVLRLRASGIARTATVVRSDPFSGRAHLRFDVYGGIAIAPEDAPHLTRILVALPDDAETMPAISDLLFRIERAVGRAQGSVDRLPRVRSITMSSPLDIVLQSAEPLTIALGILAAVPLLRKQWYEGRRAKLEAEGLALDNDARRRALQLEVDQELMVRLEKVAESSDEEDEVVEHLRQHGADEAYQALSRREFFAAIGAALALPVDLTASSINDDEIGSQ